MTQLLIDLVKGFEGLRLTAYRCPAGIWTIGYGHTGNDVFKNLAITEKQANELLIQDISKTLVQVFKASPIIIHAGENRISAIGDFVFNLGIGRYRNSTLRKYVDNEDWMNASHEICKWVFAGGKKLNGLVLRREIEVELLLKS
ncbi:lysozyme [Candidatus Liberibacter solanacearum]|uniref:Lysozyme n=1 Tax=Candidatus Liberibacter solanacearum TaxID=556287 RepID=A0A3R7RJG4_9HYPH|nr:lysozyme [Candidatus Liberibacter solanacearum]RPD37447.1 lysozyme [Candidatus Liberibacter solanacearum]